AEPLAGARERVVQGTALDGQREPPEGVRPRSNTDHLPKARIDGFVTRRTPSIVLVSAVFCHRSSPGKISGGFFVPVVGTAALRPVLLAGLRGIFAPWGR